MKKVILLSVFLFAAMILKAQPTVDEINLIQSAYGMEKRAIVEQFMKLTEAEALLSGKCTKSMRRHARNMARSVLASLLSTPAITTN